MEEKFTTSQIQDVLFKLETRTEKGLYLAAAEVIEQLLGEIKSLNDIILIQHLIIERQEKINALQEQELEAKTSFLSSVRGE